jgi:hypothetical protein
LLFRKGPIGKMRPDPGRVRAGAWDIGVSFSLKPGGRAFCRGLKRCPRAGKTGKKREMRRDYDRFPPESGCGLSYQGSRRPRIVRWSGMPVCGDWQFVINF